MYEYIPDFPVAFRFYQWFRFFFKGGTHGGSVGHTFVFFFVAGVVERRSWPLCTWVFCKAISLLPSILCSSHDSLFFEPLLLEQCRVSCLLRCPHPLRDRPKLLASQKRGDQRLKFRSFYINTCPSFYLRSDTLSLQEGGGFMMGDGFCSQNNGVWTLF